MENLNCESPNCPLREAAAALIGHADTRTFVASRGPEMDALRAALEAAPADLTFGERGPETRLGAADTEHIDTEEERHDA